MEPLPRETERLGAPPAAQDGDPSDGRRTVANTQLGPGPNAPSRASEETDRTWEDQAAALDARLLGRTIGETYLVRRRIGAGGMGVVYEAEHTLLGRSFALKVLDVAAATRRDAASRFFAEARAASRIEHPHIVDVVNLLSDGDLMVLVMELLRGESLEARLARGPLPLEESLRLIDQIADALTAAHAAGIVHRDLKPANIFLCEALGDSDGAPRAKVLDFGISKVARAEDEEVRMTTTGQLLGTPLYLSPEQARGETNLDHRVDVYALGVMLFEMLVGEPPFTGRNAFQLLWAHGNQPPPSLASRAPGVPDALSAEVARALSKDPDDRHPDMHALREALAATVREEQGRPTSDEAEPDLAPLRLEPIRWRAFGGIALVVMALGALAVAARPTPSTSGVAAPAPGHAAPPDRLSDEATEAREEEEAPRASPVISRGTGSSTEDAEDATGPSADPPTTVRLRLDVSPSDATLRVGDDPPRAAVGTIELAVGEPTTLQFTRRGYVAASHTFTPTLDDTETDIRVRLIRRGAARRGAPALPIKQTF